MALIHLEETQTFDSMLQQILNQILVLVDADAGSLMLVDTKEGVLQIKTRLGKPRSDRDTEPVYHLHGKSHASFVARRGKSHSIPDVTIPNQHFIPSRSGATFRSLASSPIVHAGRVIAVINADSPDARHFSLRRLKIMDEAASEVGTMLGERLTAIDDMTDITLELTRLSGASSVKVVLHKIANLAKQVLGADVVILYQYDAVRGEFLVQGEGPTIAGKLREPFAMKSKVSPTAVPMHLVQERRSIIQSAVQEDDILVSAITKPDEPDRARFSRREQIKSMVAVLLPQRAEYDPSQEIFGVMFANYRNQHIFTIDEIRSMRMFTNYAAVAISNARFEEKKTQTEFEMVASLMMALIHRMHNLAGIVPVSANTISSFLEDRQLNQSKCKLLIQNQVAILLQGSELLRGFTERLRTIVTHREQNPLMSPVELRTVVDEALLRLGTRINGVPLTVDVPEGLPQVSCVHLQLEQIIYDLLDNAVDAVATTTSPLITVQATADPQYVHLEISDNGTGIPDSQVETIFKPAEVPRRPGHAGIGLYYSRLCLRANGGDLKVKVPQPSEGACFVLTIPIDRQSDMDASMDRPLDILVVEDTALWQAHFRNTIQGYFGKLTAEYVSTSDEAKSLILSQPIRLAILDVNLQEDQDNDDGIQLVKFLDEVGAHTKVILVSGFKSKKFEEAVEGNTRVVAFLDKNDRQMSELPEIMGSVIKD